MQSDTWKLVRKPGFAPYDVHKRMYPYGSKTAQKYPHNVLMGHRRMYPDGAPSEGTNGKTPRCVTSYMLATGECKWSNWKDGSCETVLVGP